MTEQLNARLTFDTFVVGAGNRLAVTAARTVGESPGTAYNPLFIHGESGLGKTHLLTAIGHLARRLVADADVEYVTLDEFVEQYQAAVAAGQGEALRGRYGRVDVLLLDDVQFLTNRRELQAEVLQIVEQLQSGNHQIVLTSDRPPVEIQDLDERLLSRFDGGLVVDVDAPDYETRMAILKRRAGEREVPIDQAVLEVVAGIRVHNVRELLGLLSRIVAYQAVSDVPITPEAAHRLLAGDAPPPKASAVSAGVAPPPAGDEFAEFLSGVTLAVHEQVGVWRSRVTDSIRRWGGEGYRTTRLEQLLKQEVPTGIERIIREYERDVDRLRGFQRAMARVDPHRVSDPIFYDPERVREADELVHSALREGSPPPGPSPTWLLEALVPGDSNRMALNAANAVIAAPGVTYNPLVVIGPAGVGKTHLLHAIGNQLQGDPDARVACLSAQEFVDELLAAIDGDRVEAWRKRYRGSTVLLLDDLHLLAGKERSQEELFNLFNTMLAEERQLVFTLVDQPGAIDGLDRRLVTRLEGGLVVALAEPDTDVRRGVTFRRLKAQDRVVDPELVEYLTARPADSVRSVTNLVQRVQRAAQAEGVEPTAAFARALLEGTAPVTRRSGGVRTSGAVHSLVSTVLSREKVVWEWPDPEERVIEELA